MHHKPQYIMYYIFYGFLYLLSLLPLRVLYVLGDAVYGLLYYLLRYRRDVVMFNLDIAFPEKSSLEKTQIAKAFYHNFADTFIEIIKMLSMSAADSAHRITGDYSGLEQAYKSGKNIQLHAMHSFNWELVQWTVARNIKIPFLGVYMPFSNKVVNQFFFKLRQRHGTILIPATSFKAAFAELLQQNPHYALALAADQNPGNLHSVYWLYFFGRPTAFVAGPEKGARAKDTAVVFVNFYKTRRGHYHFTSTLATTTPNELPDGEITRRFVRYVEAAIRQRPSNYLWSHRRWKHSWKESCRPQWVSTEKPAPPPVT
ncbi:MAG: lysophospholipid acyltransferase family protein [Bacteroidota bacterium]